jgi:hypothetical protein
VVTDAYDCPSAIDVLFWGSRRYIFGALADGGRADLATTMYTQTDEVRAPSTDWLHWSTFISEMLD